MCSVNVTVFLMLVAQIHAMDLTINHNANVQDLVDKLADKLLNRALKASPLHHADLESTTLKKTQPIPDDPKSLPSPEIRRLSRTKWVQILWCVLAGTAGITGALMSISAAVVAVVMTVSGASAASSTPVHGHILNIGLMVATSATAIGSALVIIYLCIMGLHEGLHGKLKGLSGILSYYLPQTSPQVNRLGVRGPGATPVL